MIRLTTVTATQAVLVIGVLIAAGIAHLFDQFLGFSHPLPLSPAAAAAVAALLPTLWLGYFYSQNRHESPPVPFVGRLSVLGALVAGPLAMLMLSMVAAERSFVGPALSPLAPQEISRQLLVIGITHETFKYLVLHYSVAASGRSWGPATGILYATSTGLGFAAYLGYGLLMGGSHSATVAGASAALASILFIETSGAAIVGFALGRARKREAKGGRLILLIITAIVTAAAVSTALRTASAVIDAGHAELQSWRSLVVTGIGAAAVFAALIAASRRSSVDD